MTERRPPTTRPHHPGTAIASGRRGPGRRGRRRMLGVVLTAVMAAMVIGTTSRAQERPLVSQAQYDQWLEELSNWGRWGPEDELGALNLITPEKRRAAAALVTEGVTVSLASTAQTTATVDNPCPVRWEMVTASPGSPVNPIAVF